MKSIYSIFICLLLSCAALFAEPEVCTFDDYQISLDASWQKIDQDILKKSLVWKPECKNSHNNSKWVDVPTVRGFTKYHPQNLNSLADFAIYHIQNEGATLSSLFADIQQSMKSDRKPYFTNFKLRKMGSYQIKDMPCKWLIAEQSVSGETLVHMVYVTGTDANLYVLYFLAKPEKFSRLQAEFEQIAQSLILFQ